MSPPFGLNADAIDLARGVALTCDGVRFDFHKAGIITFQYLLADNMCAHIHDRCKFRGSFFSIFDDSRICKNVLDFIARCKHSAPTIQYYTSLGLQACENLLLVTKIDIMIGFEMLEVKAPRAQCQK
jgi:hypothetical protein